MSDKEKEDKEASSATRRSSRVEAIKEIPAMFTDTFSLYVWSDYVRITFGEDFGDSEKFRTAIVMPLEDAEILVKRLTTAITDHKEEEKSESKA